MQAMSGTYNDKVVKQVAIATVLWGIVGMLVGVVIVVLAFALTGFYVYRANNVIDPLNEKLKQECAR